MGSLMHPSSFSNCATGILEKIGFKRSKTDPCWFFHKGPIVVTHVDDFGVAHQLEKKLEEFLEQLEENSSSCTQEESFHEFLGIQINQQDDGTLLLTQKGFIKKILETAKMENCNSCKTPAQGAPLGDCEDAEPFDRTEFNPCSIVRMLMCLCTNARIDIALAVSQVCCFTAKFKKPHADALKQILQHLKGTMDKGTIMRPKGDLNLKCWTDADFAGLHCGDGNSNPTSARSKTDQIIALSGVPLHWKAVLQQQTCTSSFESECLALGEALKALLPLIELMKECCTEVGPLAETAATIHADVFEDNKACLILATWLWRSSATAVIGLERPGVCLAPQPSKSYRKWTKTGEVMTFCAHQWVHQI